MERDEQITFYTSAYSPYCHRVAIALAEAGLEVTKCEINLQPGSKQPWFTKVNPLGTVPAFTIGGAPAAPEDPSPDARRLWESSVLLELIAELRPRAGLLPGDAGARGAVRLFVARAHDTLHGAFRQFFFAPTGRAHAFAAGLEAFQALLAPRGYALGAWSLADVAVAPFVVRTAVLAEHEEIGKYPRGEGAKLLAALAEPRFARFRAYCALLLARPSVRDTFDRELNVKMWRIHPNVGRNTPHPSHASH
ncbi:uncharacterized protein BXZ73DRAFT_54291 [Epithele typhae]|uniref:uncharacterized protein n=1 Tax=Epithele typhae TaxID=378194 RepID=UPI002007D09D|nr:uncharacterized protein BXZ73DRAFT_54291 [Epithele typhae]KAH9915465.1 hypothetical protein BXZ73DRAFT_54291 [Epithele typhae]